MYVINCLKWLDLWYILLVRRTNRLSGLSDSTRIEHCEISMLLVDCEFIPKHCTEQWELAVLANLSLHRIVHYLAIG